MLILIIGTYLAWEWYSREDPSGPTNQAEVQEVVDSLGEPEYVQTVPTDNVIPTEIENNIVIPNDQITSVRVSENGEVVINDEATLLLSSQTVMLEDGVEIQLQDAIRFIQEGREIDYLIYAEESKYIYKIMF